MFEALQPGLAPLIAILAWMFASPHAGAQAGSGVERTLVVDLLDNAGGAKALVYPAGDSRALLVPWWIASGTARTAASKSAALDLAPGAILMQPIAGYAPLAEGLRISGRVQGVGRVRLIDGRDEVLSIDVHDQEFQLSAADFVAQFQHAPLPRFKLELSAPEGSAGATFSELHALVQLPLPDEAALDKELSSLCGDVFKNWLERGVDRDGSRATMFLTTKFDAITGVKLRVDAAGIHPLYESLLEVDAFAGNPAWHAGLEAYLKDFFELTFHPASGMPREWDGELDLPQDKKPVEVARYLAFLLDLADHGPDAYRKQALDQAQRMAETIFARGRLPDGSLAVKYVPLDGSVDLAAQPIRKLDVAAQLARLGRVNGDQSLVKAAAAAVAELEFTHYWGGSWDRIDPDFDDSYGNWGAKTTTMLVAWPENPVFSRFTTHGFEHFAPLWLDALRFGGSIAADQTRCWEFLLRYAQVVPISRATLDATLRAAVRAHFKGEQYPNGAWGDVTFNAFSPLTNLNVGDFTGTPSNLIGGLAIAYRPGSALRNEETRAMFTAVLRSSKQAYARPYGWILTREPTKEQNFAYGDVRMLSGAVEMMKNLKR